MRHFARVSFTILVLILLSCLLFLNNKKLRKFMHEHDPSSVRAGRVVASPPGGRARGGGGGGAKDLNRPQRLPPPSYANSGLSSFNGCFLYVVHDANFLHARQAIREIEDRFNHHHHYPWIVLGTVELTEEFKELVGAMTKAEISFAQISFGTWPLPEEIDLVKMYGSAGQATFLGESLSSVDWPKRLLARYLAGPVFNHPLLGSYTHAWLVSPTSTYPCNIIFDPFLKMHRDNITYSFAISLRKYRGEEEPSLPSGLWNTSLHFIERNPQHAIPPNQSLLDFLQRGSKKNGWNLCHFLPGAVEILDLRWFRGPAYQGFFGAVDQAGGLIYKAWDAEHVRSMGVALLSPRNAVKWWHEIGVLEAGMAYCPSYEGEARLDCVCKVEESFERDPRSCLAEFFGL